MPCFHGGGDGGCRALRSPSGPLCPEMQTSGGAGAVTQATMPGSQNRHGKFSRAGHVVISWFPPSFGYEARLSNVGKVNGRAVF